MLHHMQVPHARVPWDHQGLSCRERPIGLPDLFATTTPRAIRRNRGGVAAAALILPAVLARCAKSSRALQRSRDRVTALRAVASIPRSLDELKALRLRDLRKWLARGGLDVAGRVDRDALLELLEVEGAVEKVLVAAKASVPEIKDVPIKVSGTFLFIDFQVTLGPNSALARFMIDMSSPFNVIDYNWATAHGAYHPPGEQGPAGRSTLGKAMWGELDCGELLAVPVEMPMPDGCQGLLSIDFFKNLDIELDTVFEIARVARVTDMAAPFPFDVSGMREIPLQTHNHTVQGFPIQMLATSVQVRRPQNASTSQASSCIAVIDLTNISSCSTATLAELGLPSSEYCKQTVEVGTPGHSLVLQQVDLGLVLGSGSDGQVIKDHRLCIDHPLLKKVFAPNVKAVAIGIDMLQRSFISHRLGKLWIPP